MTGALRLRQERNDVGVGAADFDDGADRFVDFKADAALFVDAVGRFVFLDDDFVAVGSNRQARIRFDVNFALQENLVGVEEDDFRTFAHRDVRERRSSAVERVISELVS